MNGNNRTQRIINIITIMYRQKKIKDMKNVFNIDIFNVLVVYFLLGQGAFAFLFKDIISPALPEYH